MGELRAVMAALGCRRDLFPDLDQSRLYLSGAGRSPLPRCVLEVGMQAIKLKAVTPWSIGDTATNLARIKQLFGQFIGAAAADIALTPSTSYAISLAAKNLAGVFTADRTDIIVVEDQMHSSVLPFQQLCKESTGRIVVVRRAPSGSVRRPLTDSVLASIGPSTAVVCLPPCHWCDGELIDLHLVGERCREHAAALVVDATQYVGAGGALDVAQIKPDFLACSVHKWLLCPYGASLLYVAKQWQAHGVPLESHDRNRAGAAGGDIDLPMGPADTAYPMPFEAGAVRYDAGGRPNYILMPMMQRALELVNQLSVDRITSTLRPMTDRIAEGARAMGFEIPPKFAANIVGIRPTAEMPSAHQIAGLLASRERPIMVTARFGAIRVSPYLYNTNEEIEEFLAALGECVSQLQTRLSTSSQSKL